MGVFEGTIVRHRSAIAAADEEHVAWFDEGSLARLHAIGVVGSVVGD
jgi:hypothetical protein